MKIFDFLRKKLKPQASVIPDGYSYGYNDGGKYFGGFGETKILVNDYWTLRARSAQLFKENLYARGLIRRLVTNEINTGLTPEVIPNERILGLEEDSLGDWSELVEDRFALWADSAKLCDSTRQSDFGKLQRIVRMESLIVGDILVVLRIDSRTGLPRVQLISGENVVQPIGANFTLSAGFRIEHGVELNQFNQQVAYHVRGIDGKMKRISAFGVQSKRRVAWLVYGTDKRLDEVRGEPLLSIILQSLKEIDRYRDATQRKAAVNAVLAMFIKKTENRIGTKPITNGAVRKGSIEATTIDGVSRKYNIANQIPGLVIEELQVGEEPTAFGNQGTDTAFADFEAAMLRAIAWANQIPPEILQLSFSSNYSASQAAINEFKNYLNPVRSEFGVQFCKPIYQEWLVSEVLRQRIAAPGLLEARIDPQQYDIFAAWIVTEWSGAIKPSTDVRKQAQGYELMVGAGWMTNDRASKELTGTKFSRNIRTIKRENAAKIAAGVSLQPVDANDERDEAVGEDNE